MGEGLVRRKREGVKGRGAWWLRRDKCAVE